MKKFKLLIAFIAFVFCLSFVNAQETPTITNVSIAADGKISFDEVDGATKYWVGINGNSLPISDFATYTYFTSLETHCTYEDLKGMCREDYSGAYAFSLQAYDDVRMIAAYYAILNYDGETFSLRTVNREAKLVVYNTNGGSFVEWEIVPDGERAHRPNNPEKEGKAFGGWYTDEGLENEYDFDTQVFDRLTVLYAKWIDPIEIHGVEITGIVAPLGGETPQTSAINVTTPGLRIMDMNWHEDSPDWDFEHPATKFEAGKRYMLIVIVQLEDGYIFADDFDDDDIAANVDYLKAEFVKDGPDFRLYYEAQGLPKVTKAPKLTVKNGDSNSIDLTWTEVENATNYAIYQSTDNKKFTKIGVSDGTSYNVPGLTYGKKYYFKVKAYNDTSSKTSEVVSGKTKPNKVYAGIKSAGTNNVKLEWERVKVTGYQIARSTDNKNWTNIKTISDSKTLEYNNKDLKANKTYYYKVRAYKTVSGDKVYGSWSEVISTKTAPVKSELTLVLKDYDKFNVKYTSSKGAAYYKIGLDLVETFDGIYTEEIHDTVEELSYDGIPTGVTVYARIKACNSLNNCSGWYKTSLKITPKTPSLKVESTAKKKVTVTVGSVNGADGYRVYRSTSKKGTYELVKEITSEEELTFTDKTKSGKTYYYKVRSYKVVDEKKVYSPYSKIKSVKSK